MDALKRKKRTIKGYVTRSLQTMEAIVNEQNGNGVLDIKKLCSLESALITYRKYLHQYEEIVEQILMASDDSDATAYNQMEKQLLDEVAKFNETSNKFEGEIKNFHRTLEGATNRDSLAPNLSNAVSTNSSVQVIQPKLKDIAIPKFDGNILNFPNWKGLFDNLVHENPGVTPVMKLHHLKQALEDSEAHVLVRDFQLTEAAYAEAYSAVCSRYDNKRSIVRALFRQLHNLEPVASRNKISSLLDQVESIVRGLKAAGEKVDDTFSRFIVYIVVLRLDKKTADDWENSISSNKTFPLYCDLQKFLQNRVFSIEDRNQDKPISAPKSFPGKTNVKNSYVVEKETEIKCSLCKKVAHPIYRCELFISKSPRERYDIAKRKKLCTICLSNDHTSTRCPNTTMKFKCKCGEAHNYLLHFGSSNTYSKTDEEKNSSTQDSNKTLKDGDKSPIDSETSTRNSKSTFSCSSERSKEELILLPSATVKFYCGNVMGRARILLDSCSQPTLAADTFVKKFKLPAFKRDSSIKGVGSSSMKCKSAIQIVLSSRNNKFNIDIEAEIVPASCLSYKADTAFPREVIEKLKGLELAEPCLIDANSLIDSVDILVGAKYYENCMLDAIAKIDSLNLRRSQFGWLISGVAPVRKYSANSFCGLTLEEINDNLSKFWEIEDVKTSSKSFSSEEERCVQHFEKNYSYADDGKFVVKLPLKGSRSDIANTRKRAENALIRVERKLNPELKSAYANFMNEYLSLGHMSCVENESPSAYYIPHREVVRDSSSTTPVRVVFNASAKSAGKSSLNDVLMTGPAIQRSNFDILISFRVHRYVFISDIEKMYRMIWIHPSDRDLQRIVWRQSPSEPFSEFELNTLTYGTAPASFIAQKCLEKVADECEKTMPEVAKVIKQNSYMDDINAGAESEEELIRLGENVRSVLLKRGFNLRKFGLNSLKFINSLPPELRATNKTIAEVSDQGELTILGVNWQPDQDQISIRTNFELGEFDENVSRRTALSIISKTFDPLGMLAPVLITGKILLQEFWREGKHWDALTSDEINAKFLDYLDSANSLTNIKIPRRISEKEIHSIYAFADASTSAYCALVYARYLGADNEFRCRLICSKTRVAPIKEVTIPKLELQAAKLLADLVERVCSNLEINLEKVIAFSDCTAVLCWLSKSSSNWKVFVRNRVENVTKIIPFSNWRYVKGSDNPADKGTRGLSTEEFQKYQKMWFEGPEFVRKQDADSFYKIPDLSTQECMERRAEKQKTFACASTESLSNSIKRFSSYTRLINTFARLVRVAKFWKTKVHPESAVFTRSELENARNIVIRISQKEQFHAEIELLKNDLPLKKKNSLRLLDPFLDENSLLRVGGRLKNSSLPLEKKHPLIVSGSSSFVKLYCRHVHEKYYHAGRKFILAYLTAEFWVYKNRTNAVKAIIHQCVICRRLKGKAAAQIMGQLPLPRVQISRPFTYVGLDYAGEFQCKCTAHRSTKFYPIYAAIFVCLVTRAVHIEVVADAKADGLIEAVLCMISRRGLPKEIHSDNGPNMVGAANRLRLQAFAASERFDWKFIPPVSPNFGGIWEAGVKSSKQHLYSATKGQVLSLVEYENIFRRIEAILNSRPLCYRQDSPQGSEVITPGHFLVGNSLLALPVIDYSNEIPLSKRLLLLQNQINGFWKGWSRDYINQLQQRVRWTSRETNLREGQIVLIKSKRTKPFQWPLGKIERVFPDQNGDVRVAEVLFQGGVKKRSISNLVPLLDEKYFTNNF